jgi:hypothetical protein
MDQPAKPFSSEGADVRRWMGRIIIAVILGEALWGLIVSVVNNLVVPWLGDVMGPSSGLPTSFTQRPYNYPELFVSVFEFCIAGLVAAILNYFLQGPTAKRTKTLKSSIAPAPIEPARPVAQTATTTAPIRTASETSLFQAISHSTSPDAPPAPVVEADPVTPSAAFTVAPIEPAPAVAPAPVPSPAAVNSPTPAIASTVAAKPLPPAPKAEPAKPKKPKNVYYNIVGEPMPSDDD